MSPADTLSQLPAPKDRAKIISTIKKLVSERHINVSNPNQDYAPWLTLVDRRTPDLLNGETPGFEAGISELLKELGSSHTAFFHQRRDSIPAPYSINATLRAIDSSQGKRRMFVDVIEDGVAFQAGIRPGEFLLSIDSELIVPPKSANFRIGGNHRIELAGFNGSKREVAIGVPTGLRKIGLRSLSRAASPLGFCRSILVISAWRRSRVPSAWISQGAWITLSAISKIKESSGSSSTFEATSAAASARSAL